MPLAADTPAPVITVTREALRSLPASVAAAFAVPAAPCVAAASPDESAIAG
jgi:hypothetical protein